MILDSGNGYNGSSDLRRNTGSGALALRMVEFRFRELLGFIRAFGAPQGARLWCSMKLQLLRGNDLILHLPGLAAPLHLRRQDLPIFDQIMVDQEDDFESYAQAGDVSDAYRSLLAKGKTPVILDCGGHVGFSAVWFASRFPEAVVYSVEPHAGNFELLETNAAAYGNIVPIRGGVWSRSCRLQIVNPEAVSAAFRVEEVPEETCLTPEHTLPGYTVEEILRRDKRNRLLLVKLDIEGAEGEVFRGSTAWLEETTAVVIELHDWLLPEQRTSRSFLKRLAEYEFQIIPRGEKLLLFKMQKRLNEEPEKLEFLSLYSDEPETSETHSTSVYK